MSVKRFKETRADPCPNFLTPGDTHDLCVYCLGEDHVHSILEGAVCVHCGRFPLRTLLSHLSFFSREEGQASVPSGSGSSHANVERRSSSWGSQMELVEEFERGVNLPHASASGSADSALLAPCQKEQEMLVESEEDKSSEPSPPFCPAYEELLGVMERASGHNPPDPWTSISS